MAGGAEAPNIAALPAIARVGADRKATAQHPRPLRRSLSAIAVQASEQG